MSSFPFRYTGEPSNLHWSRHNIIRLIYLYRHHSCLWNAKSAVYRNRGKRAAALKAIAEKLRKHNTSSITAGDVKRKIDTLRNQHRREMRMLYKAQKSGLAGTEEMYKPKLWCFNYLSFLIDGDTDVDTPGTDHTADDDVAKEIHSDHKMSNDLVLVDVDESSESEASTASGISPSATTKTPTTTTTTSSTTSTSAATSPTITQSSSTFDPIPTQGTSTRPAGMLCDDTVNTMRAALHQLKVISSLQERSDECTAFGHVVANDLRQMTGENRLYAQKVIYDVLFLGKLDKLSSSTKVIE